MREVLGAGRGVQAGEVETPAMAAEARRERRQGVEGEERRATHSRERRQQESDCGLPQPSVQRPSVITCICLTGQRVSSAQRANECAKRELLRLRLHTLSHYIGIIIKY